MRAGLHVLVLALSLSPQIAQAEVVRLHTERARRSAAVADGSGLIAEVSALSHAFGPNASSALAEVSSECATAAGRRRLMDSGVLLAAGFTR